MWQNCLSHFKQLSFLPVFSDPGPTPTQGCFGGHAGQVKLDTSSCNITINTGHMANGAYVFDLSISKDTRRASATQEITVLPGDPPDLALRLEVLLF